MRINLIPVQLQSRYPPTYLNLHIKTTALDADCRKCKKDEQFARCILNCWIIQGGGIIFEFKVDGYHLEHYFPSRWVISVLIIIWLKHFFLLFSGNIPYLIKQHIPVVIGIIGIIGINVSFWSRLYKLCQMNNIIKFNRCIIIISSISKKNCGVRLWAELIN